MISKLVLVDPDGMVCDAWKRWFNRSVYSDVEIRKDKIENIRDVDAWVTAGNSFGLMDGGVDLAVAEAMPGVEQKIQQAIRVWWQGELPVGAALIMATWPRLVYAPTMRVPISIAGTDAVYRAIWAALHAIESYNRRAVNFEFEILPIETVAIPGLGTGAGQVPPVDAARQMSLAWRNFRREPRPPTWEAVVERHHEIEPWCR